MRIWGRGERSAFSRTRVFYSGPEDAGHPRLMPADYSRIGDALEIPPSSPRAIAIIESAEKALTADGNPVVRFEAEHWKKRRIASRLGQSFDKATNSKDLDERWKQFEAMYQVDPVAAVKAHSFGWPQIMGFNHRLAGFETTDAFLNAMMTVDGQSKAFISFVHNSPQLLRAMRAGDADGVGRHYNGKNYKLNRYAEKYASLSKRSLMV